MSNDNVVKLIQPWILTDRLTEVLRDGARALLIQAVEAEVSEFLAATADLKTGRRLPARRAALASARAPDHDGHRARGGAPAARARLHPADPIKCRTSTQRTQAPESVGTRRAFRP